MFTPLSPVRSAPTDSVLSIAFQHGVALGPTGRLAVLLAERESWSRLREALDGRKEVAHDHC
jgi:hypothetical protein